MTINFNIYIKDKSKLDQETEHFQSKVFSLLNHIKMSQEVFKQQVIDLTTQVNKMRTEITGRIGALEEALANSGEIDPDVQAAFDNLKASVQSVDDIVPDEVPTPEEPPVIEPEPENPGTEQPPVEEPVTEDPGVQPGEIPG